MPVLLWGLLSSISGGVYASSDSCGAWRIAGSDPVEGKYAMTVQLRVCELHRGISAFVQLQNTSNENLLLTYRLNTADGEVKEVEIELSAGQKVRGGTCGSCTERKGGLQSWDIVSVESLGVAESMSAPAPAAPQQIESGTTEDAVEESVEQAAPVAAPDGAPTETVVKPEPVTAKQQPAEVAKALPQKEPTEANAEAETATAPESGEVDGLLTDDGHVIPWEQVPIEFRPPDKR